MLKKITINKICKLNASTIGTNAPKTIYYLDTGNITKNVIHNIQVLNSDVESFPSRAKRKVKAGTILYSTVRPNLEHFGYLSSPHKDLVVSTGFLTLDVIDDEIDSKFLYYTITQNHITQYLHAVATNNVSSYPSINPEDLGNLELEIPLLKKTQQKIAAVLSALDAKIELNNRINAELEAMAKTIYDYWFIQFDFPNEQGKPYKSSGGKMVWNAELKQETPAGWKVEELKKHITIERGISYKGTDIQEVGTPMVNLNSFYLDGRYKDEGIKYFSGLVNDSKVIKAGDLMIATTDVTRNAYIIGKSFILPNLYEGKIVASCDIAKVCISNELNKYYLDMLFNSDDYHRYIKGFASGTLVLHLDTKGIQWYKAVIPSKNLLNKFADVKAPIEIKKTIIMKENQKLAKLRDWLLPMLMNGQVSVSE